MIDEAGIVFRDPANRVQQMGEFVKEGKDLSRVGGAIIHQDQGKGVIEDAKPKDFSLFERPFEDTYTSRFQGATPLLERIFGPLPRRLMVERYAQI
jgi:hypothetical protein